MDSGKEKIRQEISVYLDRIEELEDGTAAAVLLIDEGEEEYSGEFHLPENFLPQEVSEGDYLTVTISLEKIDGECCGTLKEIKKFDDGAADAVLLIDDKEIYLPENFLPENVSTGDYLTVKIRRDEDKTNAALDEARQLLKELE